MNDRTKEILKASVLSYIRTGQPVTSEYLYRTYSFGIKPAMIRWELNDLSAAGYLSQIHFSSGRLPTDKAYRFFVERTLAEIASVENFDEDVLFFVNRFARRLIKRQWDELIEDLSRYLEILSIGYDFRTHRIYESGLRRLFNKVDFRDKIDFVQIAADIEFLKKRLEAAKNGWRENDSWPKVFIGKNIFTESRHLALIAERFDFLNNPFFIFAIGPKRMDYQKSLKLFKGLKRKLCPTKR